MVEKATYIEVKEIERHFHNRERWFGKKAVQTATDWADQDTLTPFRAISGNSDFGQDPNDEALVLGTDDTPIQSGMSRFDVHRILITASSIATDWIIRMIAGDSTQTMAQAEALGQYSETMVQEAKKGAPIDLITPRGYAGDTQIWVRAKSGTDNATIDFFIGVHEYPE